MSIALTYDTGHVQVRHPEFDRYQHLSPVHLAVADAETVQAQLAELPEVAAVLPRVRFGGAIYREDQNQRRVRHRRRLRPEIATAAGRLPHLAPDAGAAPDLQDFARLWRLICLAAYCPTPRRASWWWRRRWPTSWA